MVQSHVHPVLNLTINLVHSIYWPFSYECGLTSRYRRTRFCPYPGLGVEMSARLLETFNIPYKIVIPQPYESVEEIVGKLPNSCSLAMYVKTERRKRQFEFLETMMVESMNGLYTVNPDLKHFFGYLSVYRPWAWLVFVVVLFFFWQFMEFYKEHEKFEQKQQKSKKPSFMKKSANVLTAFSFFVALALSIYEGGLLSKLLLDVERPLFTDFKSFTQVLKQGQKQLLLIRGHTMGRMINDLYEFRDLKKVLENNPPFLANSPDEENALLHKHNRFIKFASDYRGLMQTSINHKMRMVHFPTLNIERLSMICHKNISKTFVKFMNQEIPDMIPYFEGIEMRYKEYLKFQQQKLQGSAQSTVVTPITFVETVGIFMVVIAGSGMAGAGLLLEVIARYYCHIQ